MSEESISIYFKQDGMYVFLARAWSRDITHKGVRHRAVLFSWSRPDLYGGDVESAHFTYPDNGDIHETYVFKGGLSLHASNERMNLTWPHMVPPPIFPAARFLNIVSIQSRGQKPPRFDEFTPTTMINVVKSEQLLPLLNLLLRDAKKTRKEHWKVLELDRPSGVLGLHSVVAGSPTPEVVDFPKPRPTELLYQKHFMLGSAPPYFGFVVRMFSWS